MREFCVHAPRNFIAAAASLLTAAVLLSGCSREAEVVTQKVRKAPAGSMVVDSASGAESVSPAMPAMPSSGDKPERMLAAIVPVGGQGWFFKLSGASADVESQKIPFVQLLETLEESGGRPKWTVPADWTEKAGFGMRAATFEMGDGPARLECSVIPLPAENPNDDQYLLDNINRWRGQVGLEKMTLDALKSAVSDPGNDAVSRLVARGGFPVTWVDLRGEGAAAGAGAGAAMAAGPQRPAGPLPAPGSPRPAASPATAQTTPPSDSNSPASIDEMAFNVPAGWSAGRVNSFRRIAWEVNSDDRRVEIFISTLGAAGSAIVPNVDRWHQQVGLGSLTEDQAQKLIEPLKMDGLDGHFVNLVGEKQTIAGAIVVRGDIGWFFKMQGESSLSAQELEHFREFLASVKFK